MANYRRSIQKKKEKLEQLRDEYSKLGKGDADPFRNAMANRISQFADISHDLFTNIELMATANVALQAKIEALRDIVYELQEVKESPNIQEKIRRVFKEYNMRFEPG